MPKLRFKGFTDDWEQRKLGELVNIGDIDHRMPKTVECGIPYLMTGDFCGINELNFDGVKHISEEDYEQLSRKIKPEKNDILFARYASVGAVRYVDFTDKFLISYSCAIIKHGDKIDSKYLYHYLTSDIAQRQIALEINTGSQANIGIDSMKNNILVQMPCVDEQRTVASYLDSLDNLITLHQRKCDELKKVKKYMLQKMFPKKGEKVPEIRFAGFTDDWEQRKISDMCSISTGKSNTQDKVDDGEYPFYVRSSIIERSTKYLYDEEAVLTVGDGVGTGKVFHYVNGKYDLHQRCYRMYDFTDALNAKYFYHVFSKLFYNRVMSMTAKTSVDSVRMEMIADMKIPTPNIKEQEKVEAVFTNLDNLIALHQRKHETLKEIKKYMLQNMFPEK